MPAFGTVANKGDHGDALFMVLEGEVRARVMIDGQETTLATMGVGECFGELAIVDQGPRSADVTGQSAERPDQSVRRRIEKDVRGGTGVGGAVHVRANPGDCPAGAGD